MAEENWGCWVGTYEVWPVSRLHAEDRRLRHNRETHCLVEVAAPQKKIPTREEWDMAVLRLLKTKLPGMRFSGKQSLELQADIRRRGISLSSEAYWELWEKKKKEMDAQPLDLTETANSALEISSHLGMLSRLGPPDKRPDGRPHEEGLTYWVRAADQIQAMFFGREAGRGIPKGLTSEAGELQIMLFYGPEGVSMRLLPRDTQSALIYHAAQMVTNGTKLQSCEQCGTPFLSGGDARGGGKRRRDARFCKDECRYDYHNATRSKVTRKKKF